MARSRRAIGHVVEEVSFGAYRRLLCTCGWETVETESDAGQWEAFARHRKTIACAYG